jgi:hypothetical protein
MPGSPIPLGSLEPTGQPFDAGAPPVRAERVAKTSRELAGVRRHDVGGRLLRGLRMHDADATGQLVQQLLRFAVRRLDTEDDA